MDVTGPGRYVPALGGADGSSVPTPEATRRPNVGEQILAHLRQLAQVQAQILVRLDALEFQQAGGVGEDYESRFDELDRKLDELESTLGEVESTVSDVASEVGSIKSTVEDIESTLGTIEGIVYNLD